MKTSSRIKLGGEGRLPVTAERKELLRFIFSGDYEDYLDGKPLSDRAALLFQSIDAAYQKHRSSSMQPLKQDLLELMVTWFCEPLTNINEHHDALVRILSLLEARLYD